MKKVSFLFIFLLILSSCSKESAIIPIANNPLTIENTSWKLNKETNNYSNGVSESYTVNQNNASGYEYFFIWEFNALPNAVIHYSPYIWAQDVTWNQNNSTLNITLQTNPTLIEYQFQIIDITATTMKVKFLNHNVNSMTNGIATEVFYEFNKI